MAEPIQVEIEEEDNSTRVDPLTGAVETDSPDGGVVVQLNPPRSQKEDEDKFYSNLAVDMGEDKLSKIADQLIQAITLDDESRQQYLAIRAKGIDYLGIEIREPKSSVGDSSSDVAGMSSVTNPLLLEAVLKGWANARAELLPAEGPVKIEVTGEGQAEDLQAELLERDMNYYLTKGAPEYYPDTSHMLLWGTYFGGSGFKKAYRCPMRRRPVSDSVDVKDLIVSNATKDFRSCSRITHQIMMRPSVMKRMMLIEAYRDTELTHPSPTPNILDEKIAGIQGINPNKDRSEDKEYTVWETQCELDLDEGFEHPSMARSKFKGEKIPLPYLVTMDKDSRKILALRRDWNEGDKECQRKRMYVKYPYVPGPGFYGTGMLNILGNATAALTAAWREALDAGMFASFPGGLISKLGTRQNTSNFRMSPGEFEAIDTSGQDIRSVVIPMPYRDVTPGLMQMIQEIQGQCKELSGVVEIPAGEGIQNVPVGSMIAQVEQATKIMAAAHKDMHQAQSEEIELIVDLFRQYPEDFMIFASPGEESEWDEQRLLAALENTRLVPKADPNTPSHIHRVIKAQALIQLLPLFPGMLDPKEVLTRVLLAMREDPIGLILPNPPQQQGDPTQAILAQAKLMDAQSKQAKVQVDAAKVQADSGSNKDAAAVKAAELAGQQKIEELRLQKEQVIHAHDAQKDFHEAGLARRAHELEQSKAGLAAAKTLHDVHMAEQEHALNAYQVMNPPERKNK